MNVNEEELAVVLGATIQETAVLTRAVLQLRTSELRNAISALDCLRAGVWRFMTATNFITDAQAHNVLARVTPVLADIIPVLTKGGSTLPVFQLVFAETRWATWPMAGSWYDMQFDDNVAALPEPAVLLVICDVTALYLRQQMRLAVKRN